MHDRRHSRLLRIFVSAIAVLSLVFISCGPKPLETAGDVRLWIPEEMPELITTGESIEGLSLETTIGGDSWLAGMRKDNTAYDLIYSEWGRDVAQARDEELIADLQPYAERIKSVESLLPVFGDISVVLPASAHLWGIYYNEPVLAANGISFPENWDEFVATFPKLKHAGVTPIALGATFGWPALAWLSYIDVRINGAKKHQMLLDGERSFSDDSMTDVYSTMAEWRDSGYFGEESAYANWPDSLREVVAGNAAYVLLGTFVTNGAPGMDRISFASVPRSDAEDPGDLAVISGFVLSASASEPEAALSLADSYLSSAMQTSAPGAHPVLAAEQNNADIPTALLNSNTQLLPQMDRYLPTQSAYDINRVMAMFFRPGSDVDASRLGEILTNIRP